MSSSFDILSTSITGLCRLQRKPIRDNRGYFERLFCDKELQAIIADKTIVQINHTLTAMRGTVRGMHFQYPPNAEMKIVSCLRGEVFDVAVDIRHNSPTFLSWHSEILSAENHKSLVIPEGFAHGFQALTKDCELLYFHTSAYHPSSEGGLNAQDPNLAIQWPLRITDQSPRDLSHPMLDADFTGVSI
ncbi:dTDP-4-dehydrorhamnose 3,5-epimerase [Thermodesulfobacteriota bacterium]